MRRALHFFLLGALLLGGKLTLARVLPAWHAPTLRVVVKESVSELELERAIDEAVLIEQAVARGGALVDPVVRELLLVSMRDRALPDSHEDDAALLERALALGLHRADPVARQRLMFQAEQLLMARSESLAVRDDELRRYLQTHRERYAPPAQLAFTHVYLSRSRHGALLQQAATRLLQTLQREQTSPSQARALGDPTLLPRVLPSTSLTVLDARFGRGFGQALAQLPREVWAGPVASAYGLHLVRIGASASARAPSLEDSADLRARVLSDYRHDQRPQVLRAQLRVLRASYRLDVRRLRA